ncbi:MAG: carbon-nitrogen hydrolase family protein [Candidatus Heimdallarchaeota archaeon]|nr:carbon-nitrogen hydrolase family protein [Candidatus Heimdallarchaeota archaeon]
MLYNVNRATNHLKIAITSMVCDEDPDINLKKMTKFIEDIKSNHPLVELVVFGETIHGWFFNFDKTANYHHQIAETIPGKTTNIMAELAVKKNVYLCFGINEKNEDRFHNSQVLIDPTGEIIAVHRKTKMRETFFSPGENLVTVTDIKGIKTGLVICYDVQSKEVNRALRKNKLDLIIHSLADDEDLREFGIGYLARSYDAWLVNANRFGEEGGHYWNGWITISNPLGKICLKGKEQEQYLYYELGIVEQNLFVKALRKIYVRTSRIFHVIKNLDLALSIVFDRFKVKGKK